MKNIFKSLAICLILLVATNLHSGTIDPLTEDKAYIDYAEKFTYIHQICGMYKDGTLFCASAVSIEPRWVLTAAHVVKDAKICGVNVDDSKEAILAKECFVHDQFDKEFGKYDIALLYLSKDINLDFYPPLYDKNDEVGKICCISGYGMTGTFLTGQTKSDGRKRAGSNKIDSIDRHLLICTPTRSNGRTSLEFLIASGDSGGGLFIDGKLAGINSCVMSSSGGPKSVYGNESGHTRISMYIDWIKQTIKSRVDK